jgi:hypothetical protein
MFDLH